MGELALVVAAIAVCLKLTEVTITPRTGVIMLTRIKNEPAVIGVLISAIIALLTAYKVNVTPDQATAIMGVSTAVIGLVVRANVSPTATPDSTPNQVVKLLATAEAIKAAVAPPAAAPVMTPIAGVVEAQTAP